MTTHRDTPSLPTLGASSDLRLRDVAHPPQEPTACPGRGKPMKRRQPHPARRHLVRRRPAHRHMVRSAPPEPRSRACLLIRGACRRCWRPRLAGEPRATIANHNLAVPLLPVQAGPQAASGTLASVAMDSASTAGPATRCEVPQDRADQAAKITMGDLQAQS